MLAIVRLLLLGLLWLPWPLLAPWGAAARAEPPGGERLFANHCAGCHLNGGNIIRRGKTLKLAALNRQGIEGPAAIAAIAADGVGQMGGYGTVLGEGGAEAVADFVWQQALQGWPRS